MKAVKTVNTAQAGKTSDAAGNLQKPGNLQKMAEAMKGLRSAVIFTHTRPDGDTLGGGVALFLALSRLGVHCEICNDSVIPDKFSFLHGIENVKKCPAAADAQAYIAVDSSDEARLGELGELFFPREGQKTDFQHRPSYFQYVVRAIQLCAALRGQLSEYDRLDTPFGCGDR